MALKSKWWLRHPVLEGVITLLAAGFAWAPPFNSPPTALVIAAIGVFLSVGRFGLQEVIKEHRTEQDEALSGKFSEVKRLAEIVDLSPKDDLGGLRNLFDRYNQIVEQEFFEAKEEIIRSASSKMNRILQEKRTEFLNTAEYYSYLKEILSRVRMNETVYAVSTGQDIEWDDSPQEEAFFKSNLTIVQSGAHLVRYFVYPKSEFAAAKRENQKIADHFNQRTGLVGKFVDRGLLEARDPNLLNSIGHGFIMVERRIAVVDVFGDTPRGFVTKNRDDLEKYSKVVQQLNIMAQ